MEEPGKAAGAGRIWEEAPPNATAAKGASPALWDTASSPSQVTVTQRVWLEATTVGSAAAISPLKQGHAKSLINP